MKPIIGDGIGMLKDRALGMRTNVESMVSKKKTRCENKKGLRTEVGPDFKSNRHQTKEWLCPCLMPQSYRYAKAFQTSRM